MKRFFFAILFLTGLLDVHAQAAELLKVSRVDTKDVVQIYFSFDKSPKFSTTSNQRRIDLVFRDTAASPDITFFPPDEHIVKILPHSAKSEFAVSLYFRYKPQNHKLTESPDGKLVFEVLLGNEYSKSYQELAERLKGLTVLDRLPIDHSNPVLLSPYAKDWMLFFSSYETPVEIKAPVKFTSPPFPVIRLLPPKQEQNLEVLDAEVFEFAEKGRWHLLEEKLLAMIQATSDLEKQKLLALTLGEALLRKGDFEKAYIQLHLLKDSYPDEILGTYANYLLIYLRAVHESPFIADSELQALESAVGKKTPLAPYFLLSQIETALATGQLSRLNKLLLRDDVALPKPIVEIVQIHQADYWYALAQPIKAYAAYQLHKDSPVLAASPYSHAGYCNTLYTQKKYPEAGDCYEKLATLVPEKPLQGLIHFRKNMARLKNVDGLTLINEFSRIEGALPETEAGYRAAMKKSDLIFIQSKEQAKQVIANYQAIAEKSLVRSLREEALLKSAIVHAETGETTASIALLQQFLREFQTGDVRISAQALLIQLLPGEIKRLVENKEYIKALVLAKQNREFFQKNWIDSQFLMDTAEAYYRIGLYDEAQKLYLYLIEILPTDQRERFYLPMVEAAYHHGNNSLVEDFVAQYIYNYPNGKFTEKLTIFRIKALVGDERLTEALGLLPSPLPENAELYKIAGSIYFRTDDFVKCSEVLKKLANIEKSLPQKEQFMLAESLFSTGSFDEAEKQFRLVTTESEFYDQSLFRLASLESQKGNEEKALSFLREIVEKGSNPRWKQYAERELQFRSTTVRKKVPTS